MKRRIAWMLLVLTALPFAATRLLAQAPPLPAPGREGSGDDAPGRFAGVLAGSAGFLLGALSVGAVGAVSALANIAGKELDALISSFLGGDLETAKALQIRLIEPNTAVTARFGVPGLKAALDMIGFYGGPARLPLLPLSEGEKTELSGILSKAELI